MSRMLPAALVLLAAATAGPALAHPGGSNGYAVITIDGDRVRYRLTLWPATLPPPIGEQIRRARGLVLSLFGFNAGVELGQALVVAVALPALALLRDTRWETRVIRSTSVAILLVGAVLLVERSLP
ncbi:MAG: HupE/UreJ family protein [Candidatus Rokuibacteriota bacterium]